MVKKIFLALILSLTVSSALFASGGFYCEEISGERTFLISSSTVIIIGQESEERWIETELSTTMHNNNLSMRLESINAHFQLVLNIQENNFNYIAALKSMTPIDLRPISGQVFYQDEIFYISCELRDQLNL